MFYIIFLYIKIWFLCDSKTNYISSSQSHDLFHKEIRFPDPANNILRTQLSSGKDKKKKSRFLFRISFSVHQFTTLGLIFTYLLCSNPVFNDHLHIQRQATQRRRFRLHFGNDKVKKKLSHPAPAQSAAPGRVGSQSPSLSFGQIHNTKLYLLSIIKIDSVEGRLRKKHWGKKMQPIQVDYGGVCTPTSTHKNRILTTKAKPHLSQDNFFQSGF